MQRLFPIFCMLAALLCGCKSLELERQGVTMVWGMRLNETGDEVELGPNLAKLRELTTQQLMVELPLRADSAGLPMVAVRLPSATRGLLGQFKAGIHLAFCTTNSKELFPDDSFQVDAGAWFGALERGIEAAIKDLAGYRVERVVIAGDMVSHDWGPHKQWGPFRGPAGRWEALLVHFRAMFPGVPFSMGGRVEALDSSGLAAISDEVTIDYPPVAGEELKAPCRAANQAIAALAQKLGKPVFIYRANAMGPDPLPQIKNRLRFWPEDVQLKGLCLNSLYPKVPPRDGKTYYGMEDDQEALAWVKAYHLGEAP